MPRAPTEDLPRCPPSYGVFRGKAAHGLIATNVSRPIPCVSLRVMRPHANRRLTEDDGVLLGFDLRRRPGARSYRAFAPMVWGDALPDPLGGRGIMGGDWVPLSKGAPVPPRCRTRGEDTHGVLTHALRPYISEPP